MNFNKALSEIPHIHNLILFSYIRYIILNLINVYFYSFIPIKFSAFKAV